LIVQSDTSLAPGNQKVIQPGEAGVVEIHTRVRSENGIVVSRSMPIRFIIQPPQDRIIAANPADVTTITLTPYQIATTAATQPSAVVPTSTAVAR